jgi:hypothetical protein
MSMAPPLAGRVVARFVAGPFIFDGGFQAARTGRSEHLALHLIVAWK